MPKEYSRSQRVKVQIQRELTQLISEGYSDARLSLVTFTNVEMTADLSSARVFVSRMGMDVSEALVLLKEMAPRMRGELGRRLRMRHAPELYFFSDEVPDTADRINRLIRDAVADDESHHKD